MEKKIYTWTGSVLFAVNPYEDVSNLYTDTVRLNHFDKGLTHAIDPHPYSLADQMYRDLGSMKKNQSIENTVYG